MQMKRQLNGFGILWSREVVEAEHALDMDLRQTLSRRLRPSPNWNAPRSATVSGPSCVAPAERHAGAGRCCSRWVSACLSSMFCHMVGV